MIMQLSIIYYIKIIMEIKNEKRRVGPVKSSCIGDLWL